jgi:hypothetical protein
MTPRLFVADLVKWAILAAAFGIPLTSRDMAHGDDRRALVALRVDCMDGFISCLLIFPTFIVFQPLPSRIKVRGASDVVALRFRSSGLFVWTAQTIEPWQRSLPAWRVRASPSMLLSARAARVEAVLAHELGHVASCPEARRPCSLSLFACFGA